MITISVDVLLVVLQTIVVLGIIVAAWWIHKRVWALEKFRDGLIASAKDRATPPTQRQIDLWYRQLETLPAGSAKWVAYRAALMAVGELDAEGRPVRAEMQERAKAWLPPQVPPKSDSVQRFE